VSLDDSAAPFRRRQAKAVKLGYPLSHCL